MTTGTDHIFSDEYPRFFPFYKERKEQTGTPNTKGLSTLIAHFPWTVFILNADTGTILAANQEASRGYEGRDFIGRRLDHFVLSEIRLDETCSLAYYNRQWWKITRDSFEWEGLNCRMVSLKNHPDLPDASTIEAAQNMTAVLLHRFRSPMTGMQGYMELLLDDVEDEKQRKWLEKTIGGMEHLNDMLDELEHFHKSDPLTRMETLHPEALIREMLDDLPADVHSRITVVCNENQKVARKTIKSGRFILKKLLRILVTNASEHVSGNRDEIIIDLKARGKISVTNFGKPIPGFMKKQMFQPFMTDKAQNLGIGLTQAHILAQLLGAVLLPTRNSEAEGITFTVMLPPVPAYYD